MSFPYRLSEHEIRSMALSWYQHDVDHAPEECGDGRGCTLALDGAWHDFDSIVKLWQDPHSIMGSQYAAFAEN